MWLVRAGPRWGRVATPLLAGLLLGAAPVQGWAQAAGDSVAPLFSGGNLRGTLEGLLPNRPRVNTGLGWTTQAGLGVSIGATDNPGGLNNRIVLNNEKQWALTTIISPSFSFTGDSPRLNAQFSYAPQIVLYTGNTGQNNVNHNLNAGATATLVPEHLFLDVRAIAGYQPTYGGISGVANAQVTAVNSGANTQTATISVSPYYQQRFGGWGSLRVGYSLLHTFQGNQTNTPVFAQNSTLPGFGTVGSLTTQSENIQFTTGENFNRFNYTFNASTAQYLGGSSIYSGNGNYSLNNSFSYAVSRAITLLATVGYERVSYGGSTSFNGEYLNWTVGTRLVPNGDSSLTLQYGEQQGGSTFLFNGNYAPTQRIYLYGSYNTGITTNLQQQQALLQNTVVGPNGILIDRTTGVPVVAANPFGIQNAPSRVYQLTLGAGYILNRDAFFATVTRTTNTTVSQSSSAVGTVVPAGTTGTATSGSLGWQHDIDPATNLTSSIGYSINDNGQFVGSSGSSQRTFSVATVLSRSFSNSLTGTVTYSFYDRTGLAATAVQGAGNASQNLFLVGLHKTF